MEQLEIEPISLWDTGVAGGSLIFYATVPSLFACSPPFKDNTLRRWRVEYL